MTQELVSDFDQFKVAVATQARSYFSTYRFWAMLGLVLAIGGGITIYLAFHRGAFGHAGFATSPAYLGSILGFISFLAIVVGALFGGDAISTDFGTKTGYYILAQPVKRSVLLSGRYAAALLVSGGIVALFYVIALIGGVGFFSFGAVPWGNVGESFLLAMLVTAGVLSFAFCLSAVSRSPVIGLVVTIIVLLVGLNIVDSVLGSFAGPGVLWYSILYAARTVSTTVAPAVTGVAATAAPPLWQAAAISAVYAVGFYIVAHVLYYREET